MSGRPIALGGCLCGAVRFQARLPSRWVAHCHCSRCRRAHGAAFVTWLAVASDAFALEPEAGPALAWHASSPEGQRAFCRHCGSPMLFRGGLWKDEVHIAAATLDEGPDRLPQAHGYWDSHVPWTMADPDLPKRTEAEILAGRRG